VKSIVDLVENEYINYNLQNLEYVWKPNSKKNLIDFLKKIGDRVGL